jgi:hypothetical protein
MNRRKLADAEAIQIQLEKKMLVQVMCLIAQLLPLKNS